MFRLRFAGLPPIVLLLLCLQAAAVSAQEPEGDPGRPIDLRLPRIVALPGETVFVPIHVKKFNDVRSFQFTIQYDPQVLSLDSVETHELEGYGEGNFGTNLSASGVLTTLWFNPFGLPISLPNGSPLFTMAFRVLAAEGASSGITITGTPTAIELIDTDFMEMKPQLRQGNCAIYACRKGDFNNDDLLSEDDVSALFNELLGFSGQMQIDNCKADTSCDGNLSAFDASLILRYLSGDTTAFCLQGSMGGPTLELANHRTLFGASEFLMPLHITGPAGLSAIDMTFEFDPNLLALDGIVTRHALAEGWRFGLNATEPGLMRMVASGPATLNEDGVVLYLSGRPLAAGPVEIRPSALVLDEAVAPPPAPAQLVAVDCEGVRLFFQNLPNWGDTVDITTLLPLLACADE